MSAREALGAFVLAFALVLAGTVGAAVLVGGPGPADPAAAPETPAYGTDSLLPDPVPEDGAVTAPEAEGDGKTVVVDIAHGNADTVAIQPFVNALVRAGHKVEMYRGEERVGSAADTLNETLRGADAFVVPSPGERHTEAAANGVAAFADAGGRVLLLGEPADTSELAAGRPTMLANAFGVHFDDGYLYDMDENANHFQGVYGNGADGSAIGAGVERAVFRGAVPLVSDGGTPAVRAASVNLSSTRDGGDYDVVVRSGNATVVGDADFLTAGQATAGGNDVLASNLAAFLVGGEKEAGAPASERSRAAA